MYMDEGLDSGDMMISKKTPNFDDMTVGKLHDKLSELGSELIVEAIKLLKRAMRLGSNRSMKKAHMAEKIKKSDCKIDF